MTSASEEGLHPRALPSLADDFVVISDASSGSPPSTPSPDEHQSRYTLSLLDHTSSESDIQKLAKQIDGISKRNSSLHRRLSGNSTSMDQIHGALLGRLNELHKDNRQVETALMLKTEQCQKLQSDIEKLREDYNNLTHKQEEWTQTYKDYSKLKNDYNLLTNTKERLESERADLQRNRDEALAAETARVKAEFNEALKSAIEAERTKSKEDLATAQKEHDDHLQAAKQEWDRCKAELLANHREAMETMQSQLKQQISDHQKAMADVKTDYEAKIDEKIGLIEATRQELLDSNSKYEEEKKELFDQLKQLNLGASFQPVPSSANVETNMPSITTTSMCPTNLDSFQHVPPSGVSVISLGTNVPSIRSSTRQLVDRAVSSPNVYSETDYLNTLDRPAVQEQVGSTNSQQLVDAATDAMSLQAYSVASTESEPVVSVDLAEATMTERSAAGKTSSSSTTTATTTTRQSADGTPVAPVVAEQIQLASKEVQTDELPQELQVAANSDSLQRKNLHVQLATMLQSLRTERDAKEKLESEQAQLKKECDGFRLQLQLAAQSSPTADQNSRVAALQQTVSDVRAQLEKKQSELDSVMEDLDETRHKLYGHVENEKTQQCLLTANVTQIDKLKQTIRELESQAEIEKSQLQMELESVRNGDQFKDTKLTAVQNETENLRLEIQRLRQSEDEMNKRCRENDQTVQQVIDNAEQEKQRLTGQIEQLKSRNAAQLEALESNKLTLEQKADIEMRLREEIAAMADRLTRQAEENDKLIVEANRKRDYLYYKMCEYSDQLNNARRQLEQTELQHRHAIDHLKQSEQQLAQIRAAAEQELGQYKLRLQEAEKIASDIQAYSNTLETQLDQTNRQLQESARKRDEVIQVAEFLRKRYEEELQQSAKLVTELSQLKNQHTTVRADYSSMEQNVTQMLAKEHELQIRLRQAEEAIQHHKRLAQEEVAKFNVEREQLNARINRLIDEITSANTPASNSSDQFLTRHRNSMRPPFGGGGNT